MCGIFGIISQNQVKLKQFTQLGELNKERGNLGFGGYVAQLSDTAVSDQIFRYPHPFDPQILPAQPAQVALGHIRAPTGSRSNSVADIHPFAVDDLLLAHNGLLLNHWEFPEWQLDTAVSVDSQYILGGIQQQRRNSNPLSKAIAQTVSQLEGQQACWLWSKATKKLYLWRVMSPIYMHHSTDTFIFSSMASGLANTLLEEGIIYQLDFATMTFSTCGEFTYHSPYQVK